MGVTGATWWHGLPRGCDNVGVSRWGEWRRSLKAAPEILLLFWRSPGMTIDRVMSEVNAIRRKHGLQPFDLSGNHD